MQVRGTVRAQIVVVLAIAAQASLAQAMEFAKGSLALELGVTLSQVHERHIDYRYDSSSGTNVPSTFDSYRTDWTVSSEVGYFCSSRIEIVVGPLLVLAKRTHVFPGVRAGVQLNLATSAKLIPFVRAQVGAQKYWESSLFLGPIMHAGIRIPVSSVASVNLSAVYQRESKNPFATEPGNNFGFQLGFSGLGFLGR